MKKYFNVFVAARLVSAILLFWGLTLHPYSYYILLRYIVAFVSIYSIYQLFKRKNYIFPALFLVIAILFNPIVPIHLAHDKWVIIDIISGLIFIASIIMFKD